MDKNDVAVSAVKYGDVGFLDGKDNGAIVVFKHEELQSLVERAADIGARVGINRYIKEMKSSKKNRGDRRLHNTKLLLRNYHMLKIHAENSVFGRTQMKESAADILEDMMNIYNDEVVVESICESATRTAIIVSHINTMLDVFRVCCDKSSNGLDNRRYDIIDGLYISDPKMTRKELAEKWNISIDTTYSDEKIAIERLSALFFGVDGL